MLYSIADESGARLTTEGHFSFHPNADVYYMPLEVAMMKVQLLDAKGIRATFARLEKDDSIADEYAGTYYDAFMQLDILDNGTRYDIIDWLVWNDADGCYTDADCESEGIDPLTLDDARTIMRNAIND